MRRHRCRRRSRGRGAVALALALASCAQAGPQGGHLDDDGDDGPPVDARPHPDGDARIDAGEPIDAPAVPPDAAPPDAAHPDAATTTPSVIYANGQTTLYRVDPTSYAVTLVGTFGWPSSVGNDAMADIAIAPDGAVIGASSSHLYRCDAATAACTKIGDLAHAVNALTYVPAGVIDAAAEVLVGTTGDGVVYRINPSSAAMTSLGHFTTGHASSGDLACLGGVLYAAINAGGGNDSLARVNTSTGATTSVGSTSRPWMWGLAAAGNTLVGFTLARDIVTIDPATGAATSVGTGPADWYGAAGR